MFKSGDEVKIIKRLPGNTSGTVDYKKPNGDVGVIGYIEDISLPHYCVRSLCKKNLYYGWFLPEEIELYF